MMHILHRGKLKFLSCEYNREKQVLDSEKKRSRSSYPPNLKGFYSRNNAKMVKFTDLDGEILEVQL